MSKRRIIISWLAFLMIMAGIRPAYAMAASHYTVTPATGTFATGATFSVTVGVDSGTDSIIAMDVVGSFDSSKLELVSVEKVSSPAFAYDASSLTPDIDNASGKFGITLSPQSSSVYDGKVAKGPLLNFNFKAKAPGTATFNMTCTNGSLVDSNIINQASNDMIDCATNQSGSYTITGAAIQDNSTGGDTSGSGDELPRTGGIASTIGLLVFGMASFGATVLLKWL